MQLFLTLIFLFALCSLLFTKNITKFDVVRCSHSTVSQCFRDVFQRKTSCTSGPMIRCREYNWLRDCVGRAGRCSTEAIGTAAQSEYIRAGLTYASGRCRHHMPTLFLTKHAFLAVLGYVENRCIETKRCPAKLVENCATEIRHRSTPATYDRHQLLRIRLDTAKALLSYKSTRKWRECNLVDQTLAQLYQIHYDYCFDSHVTKCLCEEERFHQHCNQSCDYWIHKSTSAPLTSKWTGQIPNISIILSLYLFLSIFNQQHF